MAVKGAKCPGAYAKKLCNFTAMHLANEFQHNGNALRAHEHTHTHQHTQKTHSDTYLTYICA